MDEETTIVAKPDSHLSSTADNSSFLSVSVRAWLAIMFTITVCTMSVLRIEVLEPLYGLCYLAIGFYFGQGKGTPKKQV